MSKLNKLKLDLSDNMKAALENIERAKKAFEGASIIPKKYFNKEVFQYVKTLKDWQKSKTKYTKEEVIKIAISAYRYGFEGGIREGQGRDGHDVDSIQKWLINEIGKYKY